MQPLSDEESGDEGEEEDDEVTVISFQVCLDTLRSLVSG